MHRNDFRFTLNTCFVVFIGHFTSFSVSYSFMPDALHFHGIFAFLPAADWAKKACFRAAQNGNLKKNQYKNMIFRKAKCRGSKNYRVLSIKADLQRNKIPAKQKFIIYPI